MQTDFSWLFHCTMNIDKDKVALAMKTAATKLGYNARSSDRSKSSLYD